MHEWEGALHATRHVGWEVAVVCLICPTLLSLTSDPVSLLWPLPSPAEWKVTP